MLEKKYKYLVAGIAIILFVLPAIADRLNDPRMNRDCYKGELPFYVCVIAGTNIMEKSFLQYPEMHEYYTPQLKEVDWTVGNMQATGKRNVGINVGIYTVGNMQDLEYSYVKNK